jgi:IS5 family transposase
VPDESTIVRFRHLLELFDAMADLLEERGIVHTVTATNAAAADINQLPALLHGQEREVFGDQAYWKAAERLAYAAREVRYRIIGAPIRAHR